MQDSQVGLGTPRAVHAEPAADGAGAEAGLVASGVYSAGQRVAAVLLDEAGGWLDKPGHVVWIGLLEPSDGLLRRVQAQFGLHDLAIKDAHKAHQRPKLERYGDALFVVARTAQMLDGRIAFGETHLFVGSGYIVSVRHGASTSYAAVRERCEAFPKTLSHGEVYVLYAILDFIVDNYRPVLEAVRVDVEALEDAVLQGSPQKSDIERLYALRRDLLRLRGAIVPLVEVCRELEHSDATAADPAMGPLFRDVTDHVRRVQEETDALREVLAFAFETSLMMGQAQQTAITRSLAALHAAARVGTHQDAPWVGDRQPERHAVNGRSLNTRQQRHGADQHRVVGARRRPRRHRHCCAV